MPTVHHLEGSSEEAYDETQTSEAIKDGDVLVVEQDNIVGILVEAWPVVVHGGHEQDEWCRLSEGVTWDTIDDGKYAESARIAKGITL